MSEIRRSYHDMARHAFASVAMLQDAEIAAGGPPILEMLHALRMQASAERGLAIDTRIDSGLPLFNRVLAALVDARGLQGPAGIARIADTRRIFQENVSEALDTILLDKRPPSPVVEGQMKRAEYTLFLAGMREAHSAQVSRPVAAFSRQNRVCFTAYPIHSVTNVTWSFWDATTSRPVRFYLHLSEPVRKDDFAKLSSALEPVVAAYDSLSFPLSAIASAIDQGGAGAGVERLSRIVYGPLYSPFFMTGEHPLLNAMKAIACQPTDFVLQVRREDVDHDGEFVGRGLFKSGRDRVFTVDASRSDCMASGATRIVRHLLAPHRIAQRVSDDPDLIAFARDCRLHPIADDGTLTDRD